MRLMSAWIALATSLAAYAGHAEAQSVGFPKDDPPPAWQQQMDVARRHAAAGRNYVLIVTSLQAGRSGTAGVFVFYNNPRPFCYTYTIPGEWVSAPEPNAYRSKDGRAFAGVLFRLAKRLEGVDGTTLVERAGNLVTREYEKRLGHRLVDVEVLPFESTRPGTWQWRAAPVTQAGRSISFPAKIILDLSPDAVAQITVSGTGNDDDLARRIVDSLRTTSDSECYWPVLERMLKAAFVDR